MPRNSILSTTCCLLAIGALATLTILPDEAVTAPPQEQVTNEARTASPAPATAVACQCDPREVRDLEARIAALEERNRELEGKVEDAHAMCAVLYLKVMKPTNEQKAATQQQPAARSQVTYVQRPVASGYCVGGNCSTSRGRVGLFGRRR